MSIPARTSLAALVAALLLAACGCAAEAEPPPPHALEPTQACLEGAGVAVDTDDLDFVASTALAGALHATVEGNEVTVAIGEDEEEAERISQAYRTFAGERIPIDQVLMRDRNAVLLWANPPSAQDRDRIVACLKG